MTFGYTDPSQQQFRNMPQASTPFQPPVGPCSGDYNAPMPLTPGAPGGPLGQLPEQVNSALQGAGYYDRRHMSTAEAMVAGAVAGYAAQQTWKGMKRRKAAKGEYTNPTARAMLLLVMPFVVAFAIAMAAPIAYADVLLGTGAVLGPVLFVSYLIYRICGGGRFNTNRKGSPWRSDHQRGGHRGR